jgi:hypothetical protein
VADLRGEIAWITGAGGGSGRARAIEAIVSAGR